MQFLATPPTTPPALVDESKPIGNLAFFPTIVPADVRDMQRIDGTVTPGRLRWAVLEAMASVNGELAVWADGKKAQGFATLADVPAAQLDGESIHVQRYRRAVACLANANLAERYRGIDIKHEGHREADKLDKTVDELRRDARHAITDVLGLPRVTVELI